jgi:hypothetical protein
VQQGAIEGGDDRVGDTTEQLFRSRPAPDAHGPTVDGFSYSGSDPSKDDIGATFLWAAFRPHANLSGICSIHARKSTFWMTIPPYTKVRLPSQFDTGKMPHQYT